MNGSPLQAGTPRAALLAAVLLMALPAVAQDSAAQPAADPEAGKRLYVENGCYQCHGYEGQGGTAGVRLVPRRVPLIGLIAYVRQPSGNMPPYTRQVVSDAELASIEAYLRQVPPPPPVKDLPLLNR